MKLTKVSYKSAVFFGVIALVSVFASGVSAMFSPEAALTLGVPTGISFWEVVVLSLMQGVSVYIGVIIAILVYNLVAKKCPISWETKK